MTDRYAHNPITLRTISELEEADYNPRTTIDERLNHVVSSLSKLGFLLPLYCTPSGRLLSGHQRIKAATKAGYTEVPTVTLDIDAGEEKGLNLVFNQGTNDFEATEVAASVFEKFLGEALDLVEHIEDLPPDTFPCLEVKKIKLSDYADKVETPTPYIRRAARGLIYKGAYMPLVVCEGEIVNGVSRYWAYINAAYTHCDAVEIPKHLKDYAYYVLNFLAMDFNIQEAFKDELRYNAYRRTSTQGQLVGFSRAFSYFPLGREVKTSRVTIDKDGSDLELLPHKNEEVKKKYQDKYGKNILDFGAGTYHDSELLKKGGFNVLSFEPYNLVEGKGLPCREESRKQIRERFLKPLSELDKLDSIISSYMLNSIPHHKDRMAALCIIAALCSLRTTVFVATQHASLRSKGSPKASLNPNMEPNMTLGASLRAFKCQKFFHIEELESMFKVFFHKVKVTKASTTVYVEASLPKRIPLPMLAEAIELEFDLPYSCGGTMGLVGEAKETIGNFIGKKIP